MGRFSRGSPARSWVSKSWTVRGRPRSARTTQEDRLPRIEPAPPCQFGGRVALRHSDAMLNGIWQDTPFALPVLQPPPRPPPPAPPPHPNLLAPYISHHHVPH